MSSNRYLHTVVLLMGGKQIREAEFVSALTRERINRREPSVPVGDAERTFLVLYEVARWVVEGLEELVVGNPEMQARLWALGKMVDHDLGIGDAPPPDTLVARVQSLEGTLASMASQAADEDCSEECFFNAVLAMGALEGKVSSEGKVDEDLRTMLLDTLEGVVAHLDKEGEEKL